MNNKTEKLRQDYEPPLAIGAWGWKYHHLGIPTLSNMTGETFLDKFRLYKSGFETSPFGVEWMRYEKDSPVHSLIQTLPHLAFEVNDIDFELSAHNFNILARPESNFEGIKVAMIEYDGLPIELIEFQKNK